MTHLRKTLLAALTTAIVGGVVLIFVQLRSTPSDSSSASTSAAGQSQRTLAAAPAIHAARKPSPRDATRPTLRQSEKAPPEDPQQALSRELDQLFEGINKPATMPQGWAANASAAFESARSRLRAKLGSSIVSVAEMKCATNGCAAKVQYEDLSAYQRGFKVLDAAEELRPYPRVYTGPRVSPDGPVTSYVFLFLNPN